MSCTTDIDAEYNPDIPLPEWMSHVATKADGYGAYVLTVSGRCSCGHTEYRLAPRWKVPAECGGGYMTDQCSRCLGTMEYSDEWESVESVVSEYSELNPRDNDE